jgi:hypothetical protein
MARSKHWGHTKISLERSSRSSERKERLEQDKQEDKFSKLVDKLRQSGRKEKTDHRSKDGG